MCRHETSRDNPAIFDVNEVLGILRLREKDFTLGLGFGRYIGKTQDYRRLAIVSFRDRAFERVQVRRRNLVL